MALLYYYIENENNNIINKGINLLKYYDEKVIVNEQIHPCIKALLSPKDDIQKYEKEGYTCLEIEADEKKCYVVNDDLSILPEKKEYTHSLIKLVDYKFGTYRNPKVIIINNISAENIKILDKIIGAPIIFDTSNQLYSSNVLEEFRKLYADFDETMLAVFFRLMAEKGRFNLLGKKAILDNKFLYIYKDNKTNKIYTISIQEGRKNG